jgi:hypothetical protein
MVSRYLIPFWSYLYASAGVFFRTEYNNKVLLNPNIIKNVIKFAILNAVGILTPLYDEKFTIVESKTTTAANTTVKINEVFLLSVKLVK